MPNFYRDNADIKFHMKSMDFKRVVELKEDDFIDRDIYPDAPEEVEDAVDNYTRVLDIVGEIAGEFVAPHASKVDETGAKLVNGDVVYAGETLKALDILKKADLMGFTLPRKYGGINMPVTIFAIAIEIISRADASLMTIFGLQGISETIHKFGSEEQQERFLPRFSSGEVTGAMALTEPDSGSDLQSAVLKAEQGCNGKWYLSGVKRFITNGCAEISLVMARSEENVSGGRGLSLFIYERDKNMKIRRIENKLGIHGSPTCELQFDHAEAELLGKRKQGLVKYTMSLLNTSRLGVAAQSIGVAEAAYRAADSYAKAREQFNKPIREFPAVYEMLAEMKVNIEAARSFLYETSRIVDIKEGLEEKSKKPAESGSESEVRADLKRYTKYAALFTPMIKARASEMANRVCDDAIQVHGGVGYTCDFDVERYYRDVRVTNIYEGTTQLQVLGALGGIMGGVILERLNEYEHRNDFTIVEDLYKIVLKMRKQLESAISISKENKTQDYHAGRLVEMATDTVIGYLLCIDALKSDRKKKIARLFISKARLRQQSTLDYILSEGSRLIDAQQEVLDQHEAV